MNIFRKSVDKNKVSLKSGKNNGYFTRRPTYINDNSRISQNSSFQTKIAENIKTHILCSTTFSENRAIYEIMWKNTIQTERPQMTILHGACDFACWIIDTHSEYVIFIASPGEHCACDACQCYVHTHIASLFYPVSVR